MMEDLTHGWAMPDYSVTSGTGLILNQNADGGLLQLTTSKNDDAGYGRAGCIPFLLPTVFVNAGMPAGLHPVSPVPH
jgi:hypothetical protein